MKAPNADLTPEVSIIVAVYNRQKEIKSCLESLIKLSPNSPSHEIIVIDNGSSDQTVSVVKQFPMVRLFEERQIKGPSAARNLGIQNAKGKYLAITDSDCIVTPDWLIEGIKPFTDPIIRIVGGKILGKEPPENLVQEWMNERKVLDQEWTIKRSFLSSAQTANAFFRMEDVKAVGGFDSELLRGEDAVLCWKILQKTQGKIIYQPSSIIYHLHRSTVRGVWEQFEGNCNTVPYALFLLSQLPPKSWKTSVWELWDVLHYLGIYLWTCLSFKSEKERVYAQLDFVVRAARKWGLIKGAIKNQQWSRW